MGDRETANPTGLPSWTNSRGERAVVEMRDADDVAPLARNDIARLRVSAGKRFRHGGMSECGTEKAAGAFVMRESARPWMSHSAVSNAGAP